MKLNIRLPHRHKWTVLLSSLTVDSSTAYCEKCLDSKLVWHDDEQRLFAEVILINREAINKYKEIHKPK